MDTPKFLTIRATAATGLLSEHHLRMMLKSGNLPGIYAGNRFLVNYGLLVQRLNEQSGKILNNATA